ncbi:hypothetical protein ASG73_00955 [Janibacter sp. Soil728]|uniref:FAD binding domain-containing protein n=1 Tax=Janibacter sp. Soil728 TaxID=1736393 RepID=UPI0007011105|nr:FAD binding domain-containing protein [Janibacter sp. Soil728]KRE38968.1 hypothetical protein ASG73_00955 [Janibacter sp. Soil728]
MKPGAFDYHRPSTASEAVSMLTELGDDAKILAGGQSLLPIMNLRLAEPAHLVDISRVGDLMGADEDTTSVTLGAAITHQAIEDGLVPDPCLGLLTTAAAGIGYRAIRCRGTVGGSLAHADSAAEWPTVLTAIGADVTVRSAQDERTVPLRGFFHGFFTTSLESDELITAVHLPRFAKSTRWALEKTNRKEGEFGESMAVAIVSEGSASIWLGAAKDVPVNLAHVETLLADHPADQVPALGEVRDRVAADLDLSVPELDLAQRHRLQIHAVTVHRALSRALSPEVPA